ARRLHLVGGRARRGGLPRAGARRLPALRRGRDAPGSLDGTDGSMAGVLLMRTTTPASTTDLYELTMAAGYWAERRTERAVFELFVRRLPDSRGYLLAAGLEDAVAYLENFRFTAEEIAGLRALPIFARTPPAFFDFLAELRFTGDLWAMPEGTPAFAN